MHNADLPFDRANDRHEPHRSPSLRHGNQLLRMPAPFDITSHAKERPADLAERSRSETGVSGTDVRSRAWSRPRLAGRSHRSRSEAWGRDYSRRTRAPKGHQRDVLVGKGVSPPEMAKWNAFSPQAFYAIDTERSGEGRQHGDSSRRSGYKLCNLARPTQPSHFPTLGGLTHRLRRTLGFCVSGRPGPCVGRRVQAHVYRGSIGDWLDDHRWDLFHVY